MKTFGIKAELVGAAKAAAAFDGVAARAENLSRPLGRYGEYQVRKIRRTLDEGERGVRSRSRQLSSSMTYYFFGPNEMGVGSNRVYAGALQSGPRGGYYESSRPGGMLAIPIADNLGARQQAKYDSPRDVPDGRFIRSGAGNLLFVRPRAKGRRPRPPRGKRSRFHTAMAAAALTFQQLYEVLFLLVERVKGTAYRYASHDPPDQQRWEFYVNDWILRGK